MYPGVNQRSTTTCEIAAIPPARTFSIRAFQLSGGPMRAVFEVMGVTDIVAKSLGSSNPYNMVRATLDALNHSTTPAQVAAKRGKTVEEIFG